jgi:Tfp pilus assembly protein PilF
VNSAPDNSEAYALLGLAYLDSGQDDYAESSLESSIRLNQRFADAHRYLGILFARRGDKDRAVREFNTYLDQRPTGPASDDVRKRVATLTGG